MNKIEKMLKEYSTKKLKEIIEQQSLSYSNNIIDYAKDELIRRGESFSFNEEEEKEISAMIDIDLKNLVEKDWNDFHLEYLEIARKEYLKRGFKNETIDDEKENNIDKRFPALRTISSINYVLAWIYGIIFVIIAFYLFNQNFSQSFIYGVLALILAAFIVLFLIAQSETIKLNIDIEENTRMARE